MAKEDFSQEWKEGLLKSILKRPSYMIEVRRDGKDDAAIEKVITEEANRCSDSMDRMEFVYHMRTYATACWV